jgi:hypothetical protein
MWNGRKLLYGSVVGFALQLNGAEEVFCRTLRHPFMHERVKPFGVAGDVRKQPVDISRFGRLKPKGTFLQKLYVR